MLETTTAQQNAHIIFHNPPSNEHWQEKCQTLTNTLSRAGKMLISHHILRVSVSLCLSPCRTWSSWWRRTRESTPTLSSITSPLSCDWTPCPSWWTSASAAPCSPPSSLHSRPTVRTRCWVIVRSCAVCVCLCGNILTLFWRTLVCAHGLKAKQKCLKYGCLKQCIVV